MDIRDLLPEELQGKSNEELDALAKEIKEKGGEVAQLMLTYIEEHHEVDKKALEDVEFYAYVMGKALPQEISMLLAATGCITDLNTVIRLIWIRGYYRGQQDAKLERMANHVQTE